MIEVIISSAPVRILHFYQPLLYGGLYCLFSVLYYHSGGTDPTGLSYIYPIADWDSDPEKAVIVFALASLLACVYHVRVIYTIIFSKIYAL